MSTPYGEGGGFTPYEPAGTSVSEDPAPPVEPTPRRTGRAIAIVIGIAIAVAGIGAGAVIAIVAVAGADSDEELFANDLEAGQCLIGAGLDVTTDDPVSDMEVVDCASAHDAEVLAVNVLDREEAASYDIGRDGQADEYCRDFFSPAQKKLLQQDAYGLLALTELAEPETGDKVACLLVDADGDPLHASLGGPAA